MLNFSLKKPAPQGAGTQAAKHSLRAASNSFHVYSTLRQCLFSVICIFAQQCAHFGFVVEAFSKVAASAHSSAPHIDQISALPCPVSLKTLQQQLDFSLRVDENRNLPFGRLCIGTKPLGGKPAADQPANQPIRHPAGQPVTNPDFFEKLRTFQRSCGLQNDLQHKFSLLTVSSARKPTTLRNFAPFFTKSYRSPMLRAAVNSSRIYSPLRRRLFSVICIFAQQRTHFSFVVEVFSKVAASAHPLEPHIDQISALPCPVSLKKDQQQLDFPLHVDKNRNLPFGRLFIGTKPLGSKPAADQPANRPIRHPAGQPVTNPDFFEKLRTFQRSCGLQNDLQHKFSLLTVSSTRKPTTLRNFALFFAKSYRSPMLRAAVNSSYIYSPLRRSLFSVICIFAQQCAHFGFVVEAFSKVAASAHSSAPHIDPISVLPCPVSLKKDQQQLDFSLHVDENSNLPFGRLCIGTKPLGSKPAADQPANRPIRHPAGQPVTNPDFFEKLRTFQRSRGLQNDLQHKFSLLTVSSTRKPTTLRNFALFFAKSYRSPMLRAAVNSSHIYSPLRRRLFSVICIFAQQCTHFGFVVEAFSKVAASAHSLEPHIDPISALPCPVSLKNLQQQLGFSLSVDENSNLPFGRLCIGTKPLRSKPTERQGRSLSASQPANQPTSR
ncbi:hypothetical protein NE619_03520 [Anaerovorax odorimutans]|uniref:Uncharacterized protein n=1 Tax=Anaerovorax odorimutans TaxID=109327 RepID=A0ABT1RKR9_9FIRM|nr:hypothetical protein [Anaerovorax odorimutans]MCQ4635785.1 hypothetical protein [Anaerovorax odorimutans]